MIAFLRKHRERATLIGIAIALLAFIGAGVYLQKNKQKDVVPLQEPKMVELKIKDGAGDGGPESNGKPGELTTFLLKPSPGELFEQLESMDNIREDVVRKKYVNLRVIWPVYFFNVEETTEGVTAQFDVSEDGFGVVIHSEVNLMEYPELQDLARGDKVWLGGEITGVDLSGTGLILLKIKHLDLSQAGPATSFLKENGGTSKGVANPTSRKLF